MVMPSPKSALLDPKTRVAAFRRMLLIRRFEERTTEVNLAGEIPGHNPVYIGQEATGVALGLALRPDDWLFTTHRNHGHMLARGADPKRIMAELYGKATGYCKGKGGSFHVSSAELGIPSASAIVAAGIPVATGAALAFKLRQEGRVAVSCLGDRSLSEGTAWEGFNLAALWQAPVIFLCENNDAIPYEARNALMATDRFTNLVRPYEMAVQEVDGTDLVATYRAVVEAVERARQGGGPTFLETLTVRWPVVARRGKYLAVPLPARLEATWKPPADEPHAAWYQHEPIVKTARQLLADGLVDRPALEAMEREVVAEVEAAVEFARQSPFPEPAAAFEDVYA